MSIGLAVAAAPSTGMNWLAGVAMASDRPDPHVDQADRDAGRLSTRPAPPTESGAPGLYPLGLEDPRDGLLYVPAGYREDRPAPLILMLHGASSNARSGLGPLLDLADGAGLILLAVDSRRPSWDLVLGAFGADVAFVDRALAQTFSRYAVDAARVAAAGFSDGASYALSLGIANGDLFSHVLAFSPGFVAAKGYGGEPRLFISHGVQDAVLPIDRCSRRIVPLMQRGGYDVRYHEFEGGHTVPAEIAQEAVSWFIET